MSVARLAMQALLAAALVISAAAAAAAAPQRVPLRCDAPGCRLVNVTTADGPFQLCLPRLNPDLPKGYPRNFTDTCGQYALVVTVDAPADVGPPPHLHYAEDEWFLPLGEGQVRMYGAQVAPRPSSQARACTPALQPQAGPAGSRRACAAGHVDARPSTRQALGAR